MGWVDQAFEDYLAYERGTPALWNAMRDSIAQATADFNDRTGGLPGGPKGFDTTDCRARSKFCFRVINLTDNSQAEVFLDEEARSLMVAEGTAEPRLVCHYRLNSGSKAEFFTTSANDEAVVLSVEDACKLALEKFILNPFPKYFPRGMV